MDRKKTMIDFLLQHANPSIKKRVQAEILYNLTQTENDVYQAEILAEPIVLCCLNSQLDNGWFGHGFHGSNKNAGQFENQETCVKYLSEKAVDKNNPVLQRAMQAFVEIPLDNPCYETRGIIYDEFEYAAFGANLIRCACIARAGYTDEIDITPQIQLSLDSFKRVLEVDSVLDISRSIRAGKQYVFNKGEKWPCRYHLDILAHTDSWKNEENVRMLADAILKLMKADRPELINLIPEVWVGHTVGTLGGYPAQGFSLQSTVLQPSPILIQNGKPKFYNFELIEWLARCGVVPFVSTLQEVVKQIVESVDEDGICRTPILDSIFKGWGPYAGLQLETDWKSKTRKLCDITFRALMILHYAEDSTYEI